MSQSGGFFGVAIGIQIQTILWFVSQICIQICIVQIFGGLADLPMALLLRSTIVHAMCILLDQQPLMRIITIERYEWKNCARCHRNMIQYYQTISKPLQKWLLSKVTLLKNSIPVHAKSYLITAHCCSANSSAINIRRFFLIVSTIAIAIAVAINLVTININWFACCIECIKSLHHNKWYSTSSNRKWWLRSTLKIYVSMLFYSCCQFPFIHFFAFKKKKKQ